MDDRLIRLPRATLPPPMTTKLGYPPPGQPHSTHDRQIRSHKKVFFFVTRYDEKVVTRKKAEKLPIFRNY